MSIEELEKQIKALQEEIEKLKETEKKSGKWKPKLNDKYWFISASGVINSCDWVEDSVDIGRYNNMPIFQTIEECVKYKKFKEDVLAHSYEFSDEELKNTDIKKCYINISCASNSFFVERDWRIKSFGKIYFKTEEDAQYIIDNYSEELRKWRI